MPKASSHATIIRQWEVLRKLPAGGPGKTAGQVASALRTDGFVVTKRTVERDLAQLSRIFAICCNDASVPYGWHWRAGARPELSAPDVTDCVSLIVAEQTLRSLLPAPMLAALEPKFSLARSKLRSICSPPYADWVGRIRYVPAGPPLMPPRINPSILAAVHEALLTQRKLSVCYLPPKARKPSQLTLNPLGFVQRATTPYFVATAFDYEDVRLYAVHRLHRATVTEEPVLRPSDFDLDSYLASGALQFASGRTLRLRAWVSTDLGIHLSETPLANHQTIRASRDGYNVDAVVHDSWQLRWWIVSQGDAMRITGPAALKRDIVRTLRRSLRQYAERRR